MSKFAAEDDWRQAFTGVLLGTAVGDALGLPAEGLSRQRIHKRWAGRWKHRFLFGRGMVSDDTEHSLFVAQALLTHSDNAAVFQKCLAWKLRFWLWGLPAGIGLATLKAILKLWIGFSPKRSGVWSAGNGPAMRSAIIGAYFADDPAKRLEFVRASARLTHSDPRAETAALAIAEAATWSVKQAEPIAAWLERLPELGTDEEWPVLCQKLTDAWVNRKSVLEFADALGLQRGVTGYAYHSVPVALYAWLRHFGDYRTGLAAALDCGGDTDTVGAMVGALMGAGVGAKGIPPEWLAGICEWPRSPNLLACVSERLANQKSTGSTRGTVRYFWPALIFRNVIFLIAVLAHGFRRLAPC